MPRVWYLIRGDQRGQDYESGKYLRVLHEARLKEIRDRHVREDYVRSEGWDAGHSEGWDAGRSEGEDRLNRLYSSLIADQRFEDIERSVKDKEYRDQLYKEYRIL